MEALGWSDPPYRKLPLGAPGQELSNSPPSPIIDTTGRFSVTINDVHYTDPATAPPEALEIWARSQESNWC